MNATVTMEVVIRFVKIVMEAIIANATLDSSSHRTIIPAKVRILHSCLQFRLIVAFNQKP